MINIEEQLQREIIQTTNEPLLPATTALFKEKLVSYINNLIDHDFEKLIRILYRLDVSEKKLKETLASSSTDAGVLITEMIIERQMQKIKTRLQYSEENKNISDEEKW
jgi:hypothetical protein